MIHFKCLFFLGLSVLVIACTDKPKDSESILEDDPHSFSKPEISSVSHLNLDLIIHFDKKSIEGKACFDLNAAHGSKLILDNIGLNILKIDLEINGETEKTEFQIMPKDAILGSAIHIQLKPGTKKVCIEYNTGEEAIALQWLPAEQTFNKKYPYLFTQSQSVYARSWIPCPDGPGIRFTYNARLRVPKGMMAVMSAQNVQEKNEEGLYDFKMEIPIPAYLLALAVGDFEFQKIGERTGVYAESYLLEKSAAEFSDLEKMLITAENLYGPYPWQRYDVIVLPSSFPYGGMENPRMTFLTPSVIAGDQSLTSLLAHELAHSWSGNLVTNASWNDFWLNEGFTTYFESRIMESIYGKEYADMLSILGLKDLKKTIQEKGIKNPLTKLKLDLKGQDPEDALSDVAYEKGKLLLRFLEERIGRKEFDAFLRKYFEHFKFKSNTSEGFLLFLEKELILNNSVLLDTVKEWIYNPGLMEFKPSYALDKFTRIDIQLSAFLSTSDCGDLKTKEWTTHEWLYFIRSLPIDKNRQRCKILEAEYQLSAKNAEIQCLWFEYVILNQYGTELLPKIDSFLHQTGRRKFLMPIYKALKETGMSNEALKIFDSAKIGYHPIAYESVNDLLGAK